MTGGDAAASMRSEVVVALARPEDNEGIECAIQLGNQARDTLGYLPFAAYEDAACNYGLLLARERGVVVGYALFGLASRHVRLTHLCVDDRHRGQGIARKLVDWISRRHADRPGILVWCRLDYGLAPMWASLDFSRLSERPGRGKDPRVLVAWWRDHGQPRLFSREPDTVLVRAALDLNILRDLTDEARVDRVESLALLSDQLADRLELVRTPTLDVEVDNVDDRFRRDCVRQAELLTPVHPARDRLAVTKAEMLAEANRLDPKFAQDDQGRRDIQYVSEAAAADINVLVTRDESLTRVLGAAAMRHGVRILRPAEVVVRIDELVRAEAYRPVALQETDFSRRLIRAGDERELDALVMRQSGEKRADMQRRLRALTAAGVDRVGVYAPDQRLVASFVAMVSGSITSVPFFRTADGPLADTLARQLLFVLRQEAREAKSSVIRLDDAFVSRSTIAALSDDGFLPYRGAYYAYVVDVCGVAADVQHAAVEAARAASLPPPVSIRAGLPSIATAEVERVWWPAKVVDGLLPSYLVPIRQAFSSELLGFPRSLFGRRSELGLSREHVYYRSPRGPSAAAPARLLWYMSGSGPGTVEPAGVIGSSQLEEIVEGSPEDLHSRFRHLGVWRLEQVQKASQGNVVQAFRFANTELFPRPIPLSDLRSMGIVAPQAPLQVRSDAYLALYREGHRGG